MTAAEPIKSSGLVSGLKKAAPILVSAAIIYYYFHDQDFGEIIASCRGVNLWLAAAAIAVPQLAYWVFEVLITERHLKWFHGPFPWRPYFWVRGAAYIIQFINTAVGGGGIILYVQRKARLSWRKLLGILLFRWGITMWGIGLVMIPLTLAMHYYGFDQRIRINLYVWWGLLIFGPVYLVSVWLHWRHGLDPGGLHRLVVADRESEFWTAFRTATPGQWGWTFALVLPPFFLVLLGFYLLTLAFKIEVPLVEFMVVSPLLLLIIDLPIAFAGFGTATLAWMILLGDYGSEPEIRAVTLFFPFARAVCRAVIGLVSLRPAVREISGLFQQAREEAGQPGPVPEEGDL